MFDASMLYVCANAGRCYLTNQLLLGQTVLVSALVLLCEQGFGKGDAQNKGMPISL